MTRLLALAAPFALIGCVTAPADDGWADFSRATRAGPVTIQPLRVVEDSRCPANARCVWEGRLVLEARLTVADRETREMLTAFEPTPIAGGILTIDAIEPGTVTTDTRPTREQYRFHFTFADEG